MKGFTEFEFDLPTALLDRLVTLFKQMESAPLVASEVAAVPDLQGVYLLHHKGRPVYVGKTDGDAGLRQRLARHAKSIQHRQGLDPSNVHFKAIRIFVFTVVDLETELIKAFAGAEWNNSGFGSNDPGRERDTTKLKEDGFDAQFPIDIDRDLDVELPSGDVSAAQVLDALRSQVPYILRFDRKAAALKSVRVHIPAEAKTTRNIIEHVVRQLPSGWQATALAGRVIMYRESKDYEFGAVIARS